MSDMLIGQASCFLGSSMAGCVVVTDFSYCTCLFVKCCHLNQGALLKIRLHLLKPFLQQQKDKYLLRGGVGWAESKGMYVTPWKLCEVSNKCAFPEESCLFYHKKMKLESSYVSTKHYSNKFIVLYSSIYFIFIWTFMLCFPPPPLQLGTEVAYNTSSILSSQQPSSILSSQKPRNYVG